MNIIAVEWRSAAHTIGIVAVSRDDGGWNAYMTAVSGVNADRDAEYVADFGCYLREVEGRAFFPQFKDKPYSEK
jgi:hypothetical protein